MSSVKTVRREEIQVLPGTPVKLVGVRKEGFNKLARVWMSVEYLSTTIHS